MTKGKLIIIEGVDGSGKATQTKLLVKKLRQQGKIVETFSFPRHGQKFFGFVVDQYLNNEFGDAATLDPRLASVLYAADRWEVKDMLNKWLADGKTVILDRYTTSNMAHQLSKIKDKKEKENFLNWLDEMEFQIFKIPRPDIVIYLDVDVDTVIKLIDKRSSNNKEYINGKKDGLESNQKHLEKAAKTYRYLCNKYSYWHKIQCIEYGKLLTIEKINQKIWDILKNKI